MKDGGPAFPCIRISYGTGVAGSDQRVHLPGMSLRDWFAGMALAEVPDPLTEDDAPKTAMLAYAIADAMLQERTKAVR